MVEPLAPGAAHERAHGQGLNEALFEVFMGHFRSTLQELGVKAHAAAAGLPADEVFDLVADVDPAKL